MYSNQSPPIYTTRHYTLDPPSNYRSNYPVPDESYRPSAQPYPYYSNNPQPTTVTYMNDRSNYGHQSPVYVPPNSNHYTPTNTYNRSSSGGPLEKTNVMSNENPFYNPARPYEQSNTPRTITSITSPPKSTGAIEKTNVMSNENPFYNPVRSYEQNNTARTITSITSPQKGTGSIEKSNVMSNENPFYNPVRSYEQSRTPRTITSIASPTKNGGGFNKTLNLSDENPFHSVYGGYHYPSQIDPSKRITTQNVAARSTDNKSLNLSDDNPFFSTYGRYHYPSQIDPQKRITEMPKSSGPLMPTNDMSENNPFNNYRPPSYQSYSNGNAGFSSNATSNVDWNKNNSSAPLSYRPIETQRPVQDYYNQNQPGPVRPYHPPTPPSPPPPPVSSRQQPQKPNSSAPLDKTSMNMSPDNPFAQTYGKYHYPSPEEIKAQKRQQQHTNRFPEPEPLTTNTNNDVNNRPVKPIVKPPATNQMTEYPEMEKNEVVSGKGNTKFTRFDVNF